MKLHSHNWLVLKMHALSKGHAWIEAVIMFGSIAGRAASYAPNATGGRAW